MSAPRLFATALAATLVAAACGEGTVQADLTTDPADLLDEIDDSAAQAAGDRIAPSSGADLAGLAPGRNDLVVGLADGTPLDVTILLPPGWTSGGTHPALLALPPGDQSDAAVEAVLDRYFTVDATAAAGWVVVTATAPDRAADEGGRRLFYQDTAPLIELVDLIEAVTAPEGGLWHVAGPSNGGLSAFRFALDHPERTRSVIGLPGYPTDPGAADALASVPISMFVGENDESWSTPMTAFAAELTAIGTSVQIDVRPGENHVLIELTPDELLAVLEATR